MINNIIPSIAHNRMAPSVKKLWIQAKKDKVFQQDLYVSGSYYWKPNLFWDTQRKLIFTSAYYGWLIAMGRYDESKYE